MKRTGKGPRCIFTGKLNFTEKRAKQKAEEKRKVSVNGHMAAYKCMFCEHWHITHLRQLR